tara:strand:- start:876 stop:1748 length:873 start_codon:yes stop_codon:yes gene_type:complete
MSLNKDLTIIFVSFYSKNIIEKPISQINKDIPILVIENSRDKKLKSRLENKYPNVKVLIPNHNTGNGGGINAGFKEVKSKFVLYLDVDVKLSDQSIETLYKYAKKLENFSIIGPKIKNLIYQNEYFVEKNVLPNVHSMNFITGCALFFNMKVINSIGYFDDNIFLYYEENDIYLRSLKKNYKIFLVEDTEIEHLGNYSTDLIKKDEIEINRNWHLMWSTFYFHKKHFGIVKAYKKTIFKLISAALKFVIFTFLKKDFQKKIYLARMSGIYNAMIGKRAWFRTNIDNIIDN